MKTIAQPIRPADAAKAAEYDTLKRRIHNNLVDKLDLTKVGDLQGDVLRSEIRLVVEHLCDTEDTLLNRNERDRLIEEVLDEMIHAGVKENVAKSAAAVGCIACGINDIWNFSSGTVKHSEYYDRRLVQLTLRRGDEDV